MENNELDKYEKILEILLELSNKGEQKYFIKVYRTSELQHITTDIFDRTLTNENSHIWIIGLKESIKELDKLGNIDEKGNPPLGYDSLEPQAFQYELTKLINKGYSLVIMTDHSDEYKILPKKWEIQKDISEVCFKTHPMLSDIYCYTYDDELQKAVEYLRKIMERNDEDIKVFKKIHKLRK